MTPQMIYATKRLKYLLSCLSENLDFGYLLNDVITFGRKIAKVLIETLVKLVDCDIFLKW